MRHNSLAVWFANLFKSGKTGAAKAHNKRQQPIRLGLEGLENRWVPSGFSGGLTNASGDFNNDGYTDAVVACLAGSNPTVTAVSGKDGTTLLNFFAFDPRFRGGVNVGAGDLNGDGVDDIACAAAAGSDSVTVWNGANGSLLASIDAFAGINTNGASVAIGDFNGDGINDLAVGSGAGGSSKVTIFKPTVSGSTITLAELTSVTAFQGFNGDVMVAMGNVTGNVADELVVGAGQGGPPAIAIFSNAGGATAISRYYAFDSSFTGGVSVATGYFSNSDVEDVVVGMGVGGTPTVSLFKGTETTAYTSFLAFAEGYKGGVSVATGGFSASLGLQPPRQQVMVAPAGPSQGQTQIYDVALSKNLYTFTSFSNSAPAPTTLFYNPSPDNPWGNVDPEVINPISNETVAQGAANKTINLATVFADPNAANTLVQLKTSDGTMLVELLDQAAPLSVDNFLSYVDSKKYDGTIWHRSVTDFVVQGGGYTTTTDADGKVTGFSHIPTNPPVVNEFSPLRSNIRSTVAMAKVGGNADSATSEFFFNVANNSANLDNQNGGFTVFANMVGTGMDRVDTINAGPNYTVTAPTGDMQNVPLQDITKPSPVASTDTKNPNYYTVNTASVVSLGEQLRFTVVSNSNANVVTPTIVGNGLTLAYSATQTGTSIIVLRATDRAGHSTDTAFTVTVVTAPVPV